MLAVADALPRSWTPTQRARYLTSCVSGGDQLDLLARVAARRLALWLAVDGSSDDSDLTNITFNAGDAFAENANWSGQDIVLINPPYTLQALDRPTSWASGTVTAAAPFVMSALERCDDGTRVAAILPDVLRSGTRYEKWRRAIERQARVAAIDVYGQFDRWTNVDVFVAHLEIARSRSRHPESRRWQREYERSKVLADIATVAVGDLVPHRHDEDEQAVASPFLRPHNVPAGEVVDSVSETFRFAGRLHQPPFVLIRRTSAPSKGDNPRLNPSVYVGSEPTVVENHLIVIRPASGSVAECKRIAKSLRQPRVTAWLNERLRLRHLTVAALRQVPIGSDE